MMKSIDIICYLSASLYFMFGDKQWRTFYIFPCAMSALVFPLIFLLPESPKYLFAKGQFETLRKVMKRFARYNGKQLDDNEYDIEGEEETASPSSHSGEVPLPENSSEERSSNDNNSNSNANGDLPMQIKGDTGASPSKTEKKKVTVWSELKNCRTVVNLMIGATIFAASNFNHNMLSYYLKYAGGNIFINVI